MRKKVTPSRCVVGEPSISASVTSVDMSDPVDGLTATLVGTVRLVCYPGVAVDIREGTVTIKPEVKKRRKST